MGQIKNLVIENEGLKQELHGMKRRYDALLEDEGVLTFRNQQLKEALERIKEIAHESLRRLTPQEGVRETHTTDHINHAHKEFPKR